MKTLMNVTFAILVSMMSFSASAAELPLMGDRLIEAENSFAQALAAPCDEDATEDKAEAKGDQHDDDGPLDTFMGWEDEGRP